MAVALYKEIFSGGVGRLPRGTGSAVHAVGYLWIRGRLEARVLDDLGRSIESTGAFGDDAGASARYAGGSAGTRDVSRDPRGRGHGRGSVGGTEGACG